MTSPDLFIVGAPKCGTTSLYEFLRRRRDVWMAQIKEPHFLARDLPEQRVVIEQEDYDALFEGEGADYSLRGEASTHYIYSNCALESIGTDYPNAKVVVCLRPAEELVKSLHAYLVSRWIEPEKDLAAAFDAGLLRDRVNDEQAVGFYPGHICYRSAGYLGQRVKALLERIESQRVLFLDLKEVVTNQSQTIERLEEFLEIESDGIREFPKANPARGKRFDGVVRTLMYPPKFVRPVKRLAKTLTKKFGLRSGDLYGIISGNAARRQEDSEVTNLLRRHYSEDTQLLLELTGIDYRSTSD